MESTDQLLFIRGHRMERNAALQSIGKALMEKSRMVPSEMDFDNIHLLAAGGFAKVYSANTRIFKKRNTVSLKRMVVLENPLVWVNELQVHSTMRHQNILLLLGAFLSDNPTMVLETARGTLQEVTFHEDIVTHFLLDALNGLGYMHRQGYLHCDLKPENMLVVGNQLKISDFGAATAFRMGDSILLPYHKGTFNYQPLKTLQDCIVNEASEIFSLAVSFWECQIKRKFMSPQFRALQTLLDDRKAAILFYINNFKYGGTIVEDSNSGHPIFKEHRKFPLEHVLAHPESVSRLPFKHKIAFIKCMAWEELLSRMMGLDSKTEFRSVEEVMRSNELRTVKARLLNTHRRNVVQLAKQKFPSPPTRVFHLEECQVDLLALQFFYFNSEELTPEAKKRNVGRNFVLRPPLQPSCPVVERPRSDVERINTVNSNCPIEKANPVNPGPSYSFRKKTESNKQVAAVALTSSQKQKRDSGVVVESTDDESEEDKPGRLANKPKKRTQKIQRKKYQCKYCPKWYRHAPSLTRHMKDHVADPKTHVCDQCQEKFKHKHDLTKHLKSRCPIKFTDQERRLPKKIKKAEEVSPTSSESNSSSNCSSNTTGTMITVIDEPTT